MEDSDTSSAVIGAAACNSYLSGTLVQLASWLVLSIVGGGGRRAGVVVYSTSAAVVRPTDGHESGAHVGRAPRGDSEHAAIEPYPG